MTVSVVIEAPTTRGEGPTKPPSPPLGTATLPLPRREHPCDRERQWQSLWVQAACVARRARNWKSGRPRAGPEKSCRNSSLAFLHEFHELSAGTCCCPTAAAKLIIS